MSTGTIKAVPVWVVQVPIELPDRWFNVCVCYDPLALAEVMRVLAQNRRQPGDLVQVRVELREGMEHA